MTDAAHGLVRDAQCIGYHSLLEICCLNVSIMSKLDNVLYIYFNIYFINMFIYFISVIFFY